MRILIYRNRVLRRGHEMGEATTTAQLLERATRAFGDEAKARHWLCRIQHRFGGVSPQQYAADPDRRAIVMAHLACIEYGIYPEN